MEDGGAFKRASKNSQQSDQEEDNFSSDEDASSNQHMTDTKKKKKRRCCVRQSMIVPRVLSLSGQTVPRSFPSNKLNNQKYNIITFVPLVLYHQFKFFFNLFFLFIALSQFFKALRVGFLFTFVAPLTFVLAITMIKEAVDDFSRMKRDRDLNLKKLEVMKKGCWKKTPSQSLRVGQLVKVSKDERVPADLVLLYTTEKAGTVFIRTDQLDGETDWKLRRAVNFT